MPLVFIVGGLIGVVLSTIVLEYSKLLGCIGIAIGLFSFLAGIYFIFRREPSEAQTE